jgi:peptidoglycan hydrolase-like protein with peptidoglycan-binding domain
MDLSTLLPIIISIIANGGKWAAVIQKILALVQEVVTLTQGASDAPQPVTMDTKWAQESLKKLGFDPGPIDGQMGPKTQAAIKAFQAANGLEVDGWLGVESQTLLAQMVGRLQ